MVELVHRDGPLCSEQPPEVPLPWTRINQRRESVRESLAVLPLAQRSWCWEGCKKSFCSPLRHFVASSGGRELLETRTRYGSTPRSRITGTRHLPVR